MKSEHTWRERTRASAPSRENSRTQVLGQVGAWNRKKAVCLLQSEQGGQCRNDCSGAGRGFTIRVVVPRCRAAVHARQEVTTVLTTGSVWNGVECVASAAVYLNVLHVMT